MEDIRVSELIDTTRIRQNELNLIVAGCGTGKSHFAINELIERINNTFNEKILPCECWFVTSRKLTKIQQIEADNYKDYVSKLEKEHLDYLDITEDIDRELFSSKGFGTTKQKKENIIHKMPIMTYNHFSYCMSTKIKEHIRIIVFDEIHSVISDTYNQTMNFTKDFIYNKLNDQNNDTYIIAMTATDHEIDESTMHVKVNHLLDEPVYKYQVTKSITTVTRPAFVENILKNIEGTTLVMGFSSKEMVALKEKLGDKAVVLVSERNKLYNNDMRDLTEYIVENKALPPGVKYFLATSCAREGFEFIPNDSFNVKNVFVYGGLIVDVIQFVGRYRGDIDNLYLVNDHRKIDNNTPAQREQVKLFRDYIIKCDRDEQGNFINDTRKYRRYRNMLSCILDDFVDEIEYKFDNALYDFLTWFNDNWTDRVIWNKEQKNEITNKANELGLRKEKSKKHTFNSTMNLLKEYLFDFELEGELIRTNNDIIQQYMYEGEVINKEIITAYIVEENYCWLSC